MGPQSLASALRQPLRVRRIARHPLDGLRQRPRISRRNEQAGHAVLDDVGDAADAARDRRDAVTHRIEQRDTQSLRIAAGVDDGWQHQDVGGQKGLLQLGVGNLVPEVDVDVAVAGERLQPVPLRSDPDHDDAGVYPSAQQAGGLDEVRQPLQFNEPADEQDRAFAITRRDRARRRAT